MSPTLGPQLVRECGSGLPGIDAFDTAARGLLESIKSDVGWMYETRHTDGRKAVINYTVWSEICPQPRLASIRCCRSRSASVRATGIGWPRSSRSL